VLKGSLAPGHKNAMVFGDFGHRPMPHSIVVKPCNRTREDVLDMVKDVHVVIGKGQGSEPVPQDAMGHAPIWKKKCIFWEVPYCQIL
jgi:hypothetical protein